MQSLARILVVMALLNVASAFTFVTPNFLTMGIYKSSICTGTLKLRTASTRLTATSPRMMATASASASKVCKALKKPSLTVGAEVLNSATKDINSLSGELRKAKSAVIFAHSDVLEDICKEQAKGKGNFPGPCPVIACSCESVTDVENAKKAGASAVVLSLAKPDSSDLAAAAKSLEIVWEVTNEEEAQKAANAGASLVLVSGVDVETAVKLRALLHKDCVTIGGVKAMLSGNAEVEKAQALRAGGFNAVVVLGACVGDSEDVGYVRWAVTSMSSKQSKEFKITGMTGHVNGHYGTGTFEKSTAEVVWKRQAASA